MNILLTAINAKYVHTSLSVRYLREFAAPRTDATLEVAEYTINHRSEQILEELYRRQPQALCFSCYIWNIGMVLELAEAYKQICPQAVVAVGGPEVSFTARELLVAHPFVDFVLQGEGEWSFTAFCNALEGQASFEEVPGLAWRKEGEICSNPVSGYLDLNLLPFPYPELGEREEKILYYEASRGYPFRCQYCLSSLDRKVRCRDVELVKADLNRFLDAKVRQVKFVDRTFNANRQFACEIWKHLIEWDNGITNFHFEIAADLIDEETLALLASARKGLFQLEIGVQSTNEKTLEAIQRGAKTPALFERVRKLRVLENMSLHLDLIAGLPYEGLDSFRQSFNQVYELRPHQLQLGFLKLLKGSGLHRDAEKYGLVCRNQAPYEVLCTPWLPYGDALRLKAVEEVVEIYLNSGRFSGLLGWMLEQCPSPFDFFLELGEYRRAQGLHLVSLRKEKQFTLLRDWWMQKYGDSPMLAILCRYDIQRHERPRKWPAWAEPLPDPRLREEVLARFTPQWVAEALPAYREMPPKQILKQISAERFPFDPQTGAAGETICLFNYSCRDIDGRAQVISL